jgi:hypothetical protein
MLNATQLVDHEYLETRCMLVEIAAMLDRVDRAAARDGETVRDPRLDQIHRSLQLLSQPTTTADRSEQLLMLFTDPE